MQERLDNGYYLKMKADDEIAPDLLELYVEHLIKRLLAKKGDVIFCLCVL